MSQWLLLDPYHEDKNVALRLHTLPVNFGIAEEWLLEYKTPSTFQPQLIVLVVNASGINARIFKYSKLMIQITGEVGQRQGPCACRSKIH